MRKLIAILVAALAILLTPATASASQQQAGTTGWRFRTGNICVQDWTGGKLSDGIKRAGTAWSKAEDINIFYRTNCAAAGFSQAQTVTVMAYAWEWRDGVCDRTHVWTQHGYLKPGLITRAVVHINTGCNVYAVEDRAFLAAKAIGKPLGLADATGDTVMAYRWLPTARDFALLEKVYPW